MNLWGEICSLLSDAIIDRNVLATQQRRKRRKRFGVTRSAVIPFSKVCVIRACLSMVSLVRVYTNVLYTFSCYFFFLFLFLARRHQITMKIIKNKIAQKKNVRRSGTTTAKAVAEMERHALCSATTRPPSVDNHTTIDPSPPSPPFSSSSSSSS